MIEFLRSKVATLCVLVLALVAQLPHAAEVFMQAGAVRGWWAVLHGGAYAMALELAVLLFVVQGHRLASYAFAGVSVLVNLAYYAERVELRSVHGLSAWLISIALPVAIALYSHAVADAHESATGFDVRTWVRGIVQRVRTSVHPVDRSVHRLHSVAEDDCTVHSDVCAMVDDVPDEALSTSPEPRALAVQLVAEGLTYAQVSERLGVHRNTVSKWLNSAAKASA